MDKNKDNDNEIKYEENLLASLGYYNKNNNEKLTPKETLDKLSAHIDVISKHKTNMDRLDRDKAIVAKELEMEKKKEKEMDRGER